MKLAIKLFLQTLRYTLTQISTYILMAALVIVNLVFVVIAPYILTNQEPWTFALMSTLVTMFTVGFFCSAVSEIIACPEDRLYILASPIRRWIYLTIKIIVCILISAILSAIISIFHVVLDKTEKISSSILKVELNYKILTIFIFSIFSSVFACCYRYYLKNFMPSVIVLSIMLTYCVMFILFESQYTGASENGAKIKDMFKLQYFTLPLTLFLPLTGITLISGYILNECVSVS